MIRYNPELWWLVVIFTQLGVLAASNFIGFVFEIYIPKRFKWLESLTDGRIEIAVTVTLFVITNMLWFLEFGPR